MEKGIYHRVESEIIRLITNENIGPDERLPSERALAQKFKVSRNTIREAIRTLVEKGILTCRRGAGSFVTAGAAELITAQIKEEMGKKQFHLAEIFEVRKMLEPAVAAKASKKIKKSDLVVLTHILDQQQAALEKGTDPVAFDTLFHEALVNSTGNKVLCSVYQTLTELLAESRAFQPPQRARVSVESHKRILEAVKSGDEDGAFKAMADHMDKVETILKDMIKE